MIRHLFNLLIEFAAEKWASEYATGSPRVTFHCSGLSDAEAQIALGGGATEHPHCNAPAADFARDDLKISRFHDERKYS